MERSSNGTLVTLSTAATVVARNRRGYMLSASGRFDALVCPAGCSKQSSRLKYSAPVAAIPVLSRCLVTTALNQPIARKRFCANELVTSLLIARKHSSLYLEYFNSGNRQRCKLQCRALAASKAVEEQYVFRSAASTEDLRNASVLRAEAYYEVLRPTHRLHIEAGLHRQYSQTKLQAL